MYIKLREIMAGRNGFDRLSIGLIILSFIVSVFSALFPLIKIFSLALFAYALWRAFSKNLEKRREENSRFTRISSDIVESVRKWNFRRQQKKQFCFFSCPGCKSRLRLPRGKGNISITCPKCGLKFKRKT